MPAPFAIPKPKPGPYPHGPDSKRQLGVPQGIITEHSWKSSIYPGTVRDYWLYIPSQYTPDKPASVMIFQDGDGYAYLEGDVRAPIVFDNLIHQGKMPVTIGIFIRPGAFPSIRPGKPPISNRGVEYDALGDRYARFLIEEILPAVGEKYNLTNDPEQRALCGASSGGICAFTAAWECPDYFRKVLSHIGSFGNHDGGHVYPFLIRKAPKKPIRVYLQAGSDDLDIPAGHWPMANLQMAAALQFAGYDYHLEYGEGGHNYKHAGPIFPESLTWLWRPQDSEKNNIAITSDQ